MEVQKDFKELLGSFNANDVEYLIVGGCALGVPPVRVDIVTSLDGVEWTEAWMGKTTGTYGDIPAHDLGRPQFIANKPAAGRRKDLADLEALGEP